MVYLAILVYLVIQVFLVDLVDLVDLGYPGMQILGKMIVEWRILVALVNLVNLENLEFLVILEKQELLDKKA